MIKKAYNKIYAKLRDNAGFRSNDRLLILSVWEDEGLHLTTDQQHKFMQVSSPETIRRTRQKIQQDGLFKASTEVQAYRKELEHETKAEIVTDKQVTQQLNMFKG